MECNVHAIACDLKNFVLILMEVQVALAEEDTCCNTWIGNAGITGPTRTGLVQVHERAVSSRGLQLRY